MHLVIVSVYPNKLIETAEKKLCYKITPIEYEMYNTQTICWRERRIRLCELLSVEELRQEKK